MDLPTRLNELAAAHAHGRVNDDEYRLLRHSLLEQYAAESPTPTTPPASSSRRHYHQQHHQHHHHHHRRHQQPSSPPVPPLLQPIPPPLALPPPPSPLPPAPQPLVRKQSVVSGVANLLRRATRRSPKKHPQPDRLTISQIPTPPALKRSLRKPSLLSLLRLDSPQHSHSAQSDQDDPAAIRAAIVTMEAEHLHLLNAFHSLESSTLKRIQYKTARRLYTPTPANANVLIEGREWRMHTKPVPSIVLPLPTSNHTSQSRHHHHHPLSFSSSSSATATTSDHLSIHSVASSSSKTSLSLTRSVSSLPRNNPSLVPQPHSPRFRNLHRQNSLSSSHSTGINSRPPLTARSTGNLHLSSLTERTSTDTIADSRVNEEMEDEDPQATDHDIALQELNNIRRRREELDARYTSKLEYLRARLKAAELHEKVMRR